MLRICVFLVRSSVSFILLIRLIMSALSQAYENGKTTMSIHERKASLKEFYSKLIEGT